ncbi:MAG: alpha/beta hydrolase-fold protein [Planctomycetaceae bacterium]
MADSHIRWRRSPLGCLFAMFILSASAAFTTGQLAAEDLAPRFDVWFVPEVQDQPFTGRVTLFFSTTAGQPRLGPNWFHPEPFLSYDVQNWQPEEPLTLSPDREGVLTFPRDFSTVDLSGYYVQAVARFNPWDRRIGDGSGNGFSNVERVRTDGSAVPLMISQSIEDHPFKETAWTKLLKVRSSLLSEFHGRDVFLQAAVTLPASYYDHPQRRFPTIFTIPGFSGTHERARRTSPLVEHNEQGAEFLRVTLDPSCPLGHHVFADSANNGPYGQALIEEFLPAFDEQFRSIAQPEARFLTGHSSGGWSSLWLQITYPEQFGGVWSTAPDSVDFRDFQRINLYQPGTNMYVDGAGNRRPIARNGDRTALWYDDFAWMEHVLGPGGQLHSFEAVFSPRGPDGTPRLLWNRETGAVDTDVAKSWEPYDIRLQLERNWDSLGPLLTGKLHIFMGSRDTFLLEGATQLLKQSLTSLGSDAVVEIHPGKDHSNLMSEDLRNRICQEMTYVFLSNFPNWPDIAN